MGIVCNKDDTTAWHTASPYGSRAQDGPDGLNSMFDDGGTSDPYAKAPAPRRSGGYDPGKMAHAQPRYVDPRKNKGDAGSHRNY